MNKQERKAAAAVLGEIGGSKSTPAKAAAARQNAKKAGRPMKEYLELRRLSIHAVTAYGHEEETTALHALAEFLGYPGLIVVVGK